MKPHLCVRTVCILLNFCVVGSTYANPDGESVVAGGASFDRSMAGRLTIHQKTDKAIINWRDFSIGAGEVTKFIQPSATAAALNRVMSGNPSQIYGTLQANGRIYLINPSGILVGPGGEVNTMGFIASTLDVSDAGFLAGGDLVFSGNSTAGIKNEGKIEALGGSVILTAHAVENSGTIRAPNGTIGLAAGSEVLLTQAGDRISVLAGNASAPQADKGVNNVGTIEAARAELEAAGGNVYALAINNGGIVRATSVSRENGKIVLKAGGGNIDNSGQLAAQNQDGSGGSIVVDAGHNRSTAATLINSGRVEARGETAGTQGGDVRLLGDNVALVGEAVVDVSGDAGGGRALIGGGLRGNNAEVPNADKVFIGSKANIKADALTAGDGGRAIIWSDAFTRFYGSVSARGGAQSGDGGFVENSSGDSLQADGDINLSATHGNTGTLLYDPLNILIQGGSGDGDDQGNVSGTSLRNVAPGDTPPGSDTLGSILFTDEGAGSPDPFVIRESEIEGTAANIILEARNSIKVGGTFNNQVSSEGNNVVLIQSGHSLTMRTRNDTGDGIEGIDLTAGGTLNNLEFRTQGSGSITLQTGNDGAGAGGSEIGSAPITVGKLTTGSGNITLSAEGTLTVNGSLATADISGGNDEGVATGFISLSSKDANVVINASVSTGDATVDDGDSDRTGRSGNISIAAGTSVEVNASLTTGNISWIGGINATGNDNAQSGNIDINPTVAGTGSILINGDVRTGNAVIVDGEGGSDENDTATSGSIGLRTGTSITGTGRLITGDASVIGSDADGTDRAISGNVSATAGSGMASGGIGLGGITIGTAQRTGGGAVDAATAGNITLNSFGEINNGMASQPLSVLIGAASGSGNNNQGSLAATTTGAGGNIFITSSSGLEVGALKTAAGSAQTVEVTLTGPASTLRVNNGDEMLSGDNVSLNAGAGTLVIADAAFDVGNGSLTLTANEINLNGGDNSIQGMNGNLVVQPATADRPIQLGAAAGVGSDGALDIDDDDLDALADGFDTIIIGRVADGSGTVTIAGTASFSDKVTVAGGSIASNARLTSTEDVTLIARTGGITDGNAGNVNVEAPTLFARAETGIDLDTTIMTLASAQVNAVGNINISDTDDVVLKTINASGDTVTIHAEGSILDDADDNTRLTAGTAVLTADAIGEAGNEIDTTVDTLTATASDGGVFIREENGVRLQSVSASGGANAVDIRNAAGNMTVVSVTAPGRITLDSAGSVLNDGDTATRIRSSGAFNTTIRAGVNIGTTANPLDVDGVSGGTVNLEALVGAVHVNTVSDGLVEFTASSDAVPGRIITSFTRAGGPLYNATYANSAAGDFTLTAHGDIRQGTLVGPVLAPAAVLTLNSVMPGADIGTAAIPLLVRARDLSLNTVGDAGANGNASVQGDAINFSASSVDGTLRATATVGNITDNGAVTVTGNADFTTTASGGDIVLNSGLNVSGTIGLHTGDALSDATIINGSDIDFAASTVGGILSATANGSIMQSGDIMATELRATANGGAVTLDGNNDVSRLAGSASGNGNGFSFTDINNLTIATVDGVAGIRTDNGAVSLTADSMDVAETVISGMARTTLQPRTGGRNIDLGSEAAGKLSLTDAEVDSVHAGVLQIGNSSAGSIDVSAAVAPANASTLSLVNNGSVSGAGNITVPSLRINAGGPVTLTGDNDVTTLAAGVSSAGSAFSFRDQNGLNVGTVDGIAGISTANGAVTLTADSLGIGASVNSGMARTTLEPATSGREIDLGSETGGKLSLTDTELDSVGAGVLQIGNNSAGSINVSADLTQTAKPTLTLVSGGSVSGAGSIEASALRIRSVGSVTLDNNNDVSTLAATVLGANNRFSFTDSGSVNVGAVDGDAGITTLGGSVDLVTDSLGIQSSINSGNGSVTLTADSMAVGAGVNSGMARAILQPRANGRNIDLGSETAGKFSLTDAELDNVTASVLQVGNNRSGSIDVSAAISPAGASTLSLINNSSVSGDGNVRVGDLNVRAAGQVNLQGNVTTLAGFASGGNRFAFRDNNNVTIGTVDGRAGILTQGGDIAVTADSLDIADRVQSGGGSVTLTANRLDIGEQVNAGQAGVVTIQPLSAGKAINLGSESGSALSLSGDELNRVTADIIRVGNLTAGAIDINESLTLGNRVLTLQSGDSIEETGAGSLTVDELCIGTARSSAVVSLAGQNDVNVLAAEGAPVTFHDIDDLDRLTAVDLCPPGVPVGSDLQLFGGNVTVRVLSEQLAAIAFVDIPTPRAANRTLFAETAIDSSLVATLVGLDSIWTSSLHVPFAGEEPLRYRIEEESKWLGGHLAISGTTTGPQTPR